MTTRVSSNNLLIANELYDFINQQVLPCTKLSSQQFWLAMSSIIEEFSAENQQLLETRSKLQKQINQWHKTNQYNSEDLTSYKNFLQQIGYIETPVEDFSITTSNVDEELATMAGPQLVVPITNARFALNAVNARWGSLYDALYGTDAISESNGAEKSGSYNPVRGQQVINYGRDFLDQVIPLKQGSHHQVIDYQVNDQQLQITLADKTTTQLLNPEQWLGYQGAASNPSAILFEHNNLKFELKFDSGNEISSRDLAGISDIIMESALTTIMDCEDSVATVDAQDKVVAYSNWLGLIKGELSTQVTKEHQTFMRKMAKDKQYLAADNTAFTISGRSVMFVRNVGHLMQNDAILTSDNQPVYEGLLDAMVTSLIGSIDVNSNNEFKNSKFGSIYIVKPKMHGSAEVAFTDKVFTRVEQLLGLNKNTIKLGIMDEERRTSLNLKNCINAAKDRVVFINTGFLDRTGDEIHTSMLAGVVERKNDIKKTRWISAYEHHNVLTGLSCGMSGKGQIGKGMWAIPDNMADMLEQKIAHVNAGANTAWVPSPTAATLHALHYHQENVFTIQQNIADLNTQALLDEMLQIPLATSTNWSEATITQELENNVQGILGYVVRWINQGIGCSKVPDINNVGLMEDRATLRISSQHIANWLHHGICQPEQVEQVIEKMAKIVDSQNTGDATYVPMVSNWQTSMAVKAARALIFEAQHQPNGYTEPLLHHFRYQLKHGKS
ncbi:malate synthase G [Thalassotalea marina]|uniref:Malate synthase G n=1 Tax=Thalassotalea marina TaxID=1673741 RepID=A0A919BEQ8_9GAMM|nr:malate synthase G [Thalassotalea marina]GHF83980.1 malate synthase G [Thalassotalea marina]